MFYTSRRLRKDLGPIQGSHYIWLSYHQMLAALVWQKNWKHLEVQSAIAFLLGSILFVVGSIAELRDQIIFKTLFMLGSMMFFVGGFVQLWQTIRAWNRNKNYILVSFGLALIGVISAKAGTLFFNIESISSWLNLDIASETKQLLGPDAYMAGSVLFLTSGIAHYVEISHGRFLFIEKNHLAWWSCISYLLGSLLYCLSALLGLDKAIDWPITFSAANNSIVLCLIASALFIFMSLCLLAECSENEIANRRGNTLPQSEYLSRFRKQIRSMNL